MALKVGQTPVQGTRPQAQQEADGGRAAGGDFFGAFRVLPQARFKETESGLKVAVVREGQGTPLAKGMRVKVHYAGWLADGKGFDSSVERGKPFEFVLGAGRVIKGWEEGLAGIKPGERRQIIVPPELAYGDRQMPDIPPGSTLVFNVEALAVEDPHANANPKGTMTVVA